MLPRTTLVNCSSGLRGARSRMSSMRRNDNPIGSARPCTASATDPLDTRSGLIAYPSAVKKLANIVFPRRITGAVKARTRPANQTGDRDGHRLPCYARNADRLDSRLAGRVGAHPLDAHCGCPKPSADQRVVRPDDFVARRREAAIGRSPSSLCSPPPQWRSWPWRLRFGASETARRTCCCALRGRPCRAHRHRRPRTDRPGSPAQ